MTSSHDIRSSFLQFFQEKGHHVYPSASLIPHNDPSLLFTTAGMVPFKDIFTGAQKAAYPCATSAQKCVRAGGKHNDLDQVGYTARHHTFFEMLGNFSFGDYFKEKAILYAWEYLTKILALPKEKLWVTVYHTDDEAFKLWEKIANIPAHRIIRISTLDNFWSAGDVGPCGPCSEIFYDHGDHIPGGPPGSAEADGDRFIELWNIVFMELEQTPSGERVLLPSPSIDTGMGLERISAVMQGVHDNFETDLFTPIISRSQQLAGAHDSHSVSHRVIADHLRSICFLIADGILPSNEGRGYVLRRIIRRALRHVHYLGSSCTHMTHLVPVLVEIMGIAYPELARAQRLIESVLTQEGERFQHLLKTGLDMLTTWIDQSKGRKVLPGSYAFQLYDTYGFPLDLTQDILREKGISVDEQEFCQCMEQQKNLSRQSWVGSGESTHDSFWTSVYDTIGASIFLGHTTLSAQEKIQYLSTGDETACTLAAGQEGCVVVCRTPFYPQSGGQIGDQGWIQGPNGRFQVHDTQQQGHLIIHKGIITEGSLSKGEMVSLQVDETKRSRIQIHHSATHLLQAALRAVLGDHVIQKGSLVTDEKLRFDFSHPSPLTSPQIEMLEVMVNKWIRNNFAVTDEKMSQKVAIESGAMALFGEKYEDEVRVITMGEASKELCGGTHVSSTGTIGVFKILSESSVACGIRRIEAVAGQAGLEHFQHLHTQLKQVCTLLKCSSSDVEEKISRLLSKKSTSSAVSYAPVTKETIGSISLWYSHESSTEAKNLRSIIDQYKTQMKSGIAMVTHTSEGKMSVLIGVTKDLADRWNAVDLLKIVLQTSKGGGRPDFAQGGCPSQDSVTLVKRLKDALVSPPDSWQ